MGCNCGQRKQQAIEKKRAELEAELKGQITEQARILETRIKNRIEERAKRKIFI